eukprot:Rhum_TRINITY_DN17140_c0_g1::Rhum_TRINITY_DN17140_c0_g1_i1::g.165303::m.165303
MGDKTLIAELPRMTSADYAEFESTVRPWGLQRSIRRQQVQLAGLGGLAGAGFGYAWSVKSRGNTWLVGAFMALSFGIGGAVIGHTAGLNVFPSIASNSETTMMRRTWWAKKCVEQQ